MLMVKARYDAHQASLAWAEAVRPLLDYQDELGAVPIDEQAELFKESCQLVGLDWKHEAFAKERLALVKKYQELDSRLMEQLDNAPMN